jgi:hypothetical protein
MTSKIYINLYFNWSSKTNNFHKCIPVSEKQRGARAILGLSGITLLVVVISLNLGDYF